MPALTLNLARIQAIFQDDEAGVRELLHASAEALGEDVSRLAEAIAQGNAAAAGGAAHALKGACANIGAECLALQAAALEREIEGACRLPEMQGMLRVLQSEEAALQAEIFAYCSERLAG